MIARILYRVPAIDVPPSTLCEPCLKSENHVLRAAATEYLRLSVGFRTYASSTGHAEHDNTEHRMAMVVSRRAQLPHFVAEREVSLGEATLLHIAPAYGYSRCWPDHTSQWYRNRSPAVEPLSLQSIPSAGGRCRFQNRGRWQASIRSLELLSGCDHELSSSADSVASAFS